MGLNVITGATGHLGNVLARELAASGRPVRAVVQSGDDLRPLAGLGVELVEADVNDPPALRRAFSGAARVFHLAGVVSISGPGQQARLERVNVEGTRHVVAACRAEQVGRLVYMSSVHALVEPRGGTLDERAGFDPARAVGPYARTKAEASLAVQAAARRGELDAVLVLPTGVLGPFDFRQSEMGQLLGELAADKVPFLLPGGHDWVDVRDVARGTLAAAERGRSGEAYLLGGEVRSLEDLARLVAVETRCRVPPLVPAWLARAVAAGAPVFERVTGRRALLTPYALHALSAPFTVSHEKAARELSYFPRPIAIAVRDALAWRQAQREPRPVVGPGRARLGGAAC